MEKPDLTVARLGLAAEGADFGPLGQQVFYGVGKESGKTVKIAIHPPQVFEKDGTFKAPAEKPFFTVKQQFFIAGAQKTALVGMDGIFVPTAA
jgi:hypothetical protein